MNWQDPPPARISCHEWTRAFATVPDELIQKYRYYGATDQSWSIYLSPPATFSVYGARHLKDLHFDNSLAALRLWGFVMNETERLFRARQTGKRIIATLGDLGALPALISAFDNAVAFYPDCLWWTPFMRTSRVLLDEADTCGLDETFCYSRAALAGFAKGSYFPKPDLCIASTGASCDDYCSVMAQVERLGHEVLWLETPFRPDDDPAARDRARALLVGEYVRALNRLKTQDPRLKTGDSGLQTPRVPSGQVADGRWQMAAHSPTPTHRYPDALIRGALERVNRVRKLTREIREMVYGSEVGLLPALEMMLVEFGCLHYYSDLSEWTEILEHIKETVAERARKGLGVGRPDDVRVVWVTPPADPVFLCYLESKGGRVAGTEYVINQALVPIPDRPDPLEGLAESFLEASLIGTSAARAELVINQAREHQTEGVIISGIFGASHCATENHVIREEVAKAIGLPVLEFDVPAPGVGVTSGLETRIEAFLELCRSRR